jgi:phosphate transport system permease protein
MNPTDVVPPARPAREQALRLARIAPRPRPVRPSTPRAPRAARTRLIVAPRRHSRLGDEAFRTTALLFALSVFVVTGVIFVTLVVDSAPSREALGWRFLWTSTWDPVFGDFGALPFAFGTLATSAIALLIALPLGLGAAICLAELVPEHVSDPLTFLVELLVAVPSVVYGLVGVFVLVPLMRIVGTPIADTFGWIPLFKGPVYGIGLLTAGVLLAFMVLPFIVAVSREVLLAVPQSQRDASLALGATRWETVRHVVLPYARSGILGSVFLALARALGETMAVTMVIGNRPDISASLFAPAHTMAAVLANEFTEATGDVYLSALIEIALVLFGITLIINALARLLVGAVRNSPAAAG